MPNLCRSIHAARIARRSPDRKVILTVVVHDFIHLSQFLTHDLINELIIIIVLKGVATHIHCAMNKQADTFIKVKFDKIIFMLYAMLHHCFDLTVNEFDAMHCRMKKNTEFGSQIELLLHPFEFRNQIWNDSIWWVFFSMFGQIEMHEGANITPCYVLLKN